MRVLMMRRLALVAASAAAAVLPATAQQPRREAPPALGAPKAFKLPPKREFALANGMKVTFVPFGTIPKVSVYTMVGTGHIDEGSDEVSLSDVTGEMMREGTTTRTATQIAEQVAGMGGELQVFVGDDRTQVGGAVLSERGPDMVRLEADLLRNPRFPENELKRITTNKAREVAIAKSQPQSIAQEQFLKTMYGDHPYGRLFSTDTMLNSFTIAQVRSFHARNFGAARSHLYVVGVFDAAAMERAVREAFEGWTTGQPATVKKPNPRKGHSVALLGGTFGSRVTTNIREQKGYTYSPYSFIGTHRHDAYWVQQADVTTQHTGASLKEIFGEIDRLRKEPPPAPELNGIKNNMIGIFTLRNASRGGIINQLAEADLQGLGDEYLSGYVQRVMAVSPAEVQHAAVNHLTPDRMTLVVVGDKATVAEQLAPYQRPIP